ncbi:MAG: hypothetical protein RII27_00845 [Alphaproteobacteria bacterium]
MAVAFSRHLVASPLQVAAALRCLVAGDAVSLRLVDQAGCDMLLAAEAGLPVRRSRPVQTTGGATVMQDFWICWPPPADTPFHPAADAIEALVNEGLALGDPPLCAPLRLSDRVVQRYPVGSAGIGFHRDHIRYERLILILLLKGKGRFRIAEDRAGSAANDVPLGPGEAVLMRAPGFPGDRKRPFHAVDNIVEERVIFSLRHDARADRPEYLERT